MKQLLVMKRLFSLKPLSLALIISLSGATIVNASQPASSSQIPTVEKEFVDAMTAGVEKAKIIAQFGEPAKKDDIEDAGKVVASIWQYHNINTTVDGKPYETTELDFVNDKVVMVVFMNHDGTDQATSKSVPIEPQAEPATPGLTPEI